MSLLAANVPDVSVAVMQRLEKMFPVAQPVPNVTTLDELMYNAGARAVIDYLREKYSRDSIITGSL